MLSWLANTRLIYIFSNLLVIPATFIPAIDLLSNISFIVIIFLLFKTNLLLLLIACMVFILKNNANYRFNLLLKIKGDELSKSDSQCVYLYAWCTLLRYFLLGIAANQLYLLF